jgi:hypothetical protein
MKRTAEEARLANKADDRKERRSKMESKQPWRKAIEKFQADKARKKPQNSR